MYTHRTDRIVWSDLLIEEDWEQLAADGLIADVDGLIGHQKNDVLEESPISLNFGGKECG